MSVLDVSGVGLAARHPGLTGVHSLVGDVDFLVWVGQGAVPLRDSSVVPYAPEQTTEVSTLSSNF